MEVIWRAMCDAAVARVGTRVAALGADHRAADWAFVFCLVERERLEEAWRTRSNEAGLQLCLAIQHELCVQSWDHVFQRDWGHVFLQRANHNQTVIGLDQPRFVQANIRCNEP